jgi:S1-C subfamily serine protease
MGQRNPGHRGRLVITLIVLLAVLPASAAAQQTSGLVVEEILAGSEAANAGVQLNDRLLGYAGRTLPSPAALQVAEENIIGKPDLELRVRRGGEMLTLIVKSGRLGIRVRPELASAALVMTKARLPRRNRSSTKR